MSRIVELSDEDCALVSGGGNGMMGSGARQETGDEADRSGPLLGSGT